MELGHSSIKQIIDLSGKRLLACRLFADDSLSIINGKWN